jgi:hypothetical protein
VFEENMSFGQRKKGEVAWTYITRGKSEMYNFVTISPRGRSVGKLTCRLEESFKIDM